ncbi:hypothetical protein FHS41_000494 [Streptomyces violarus]|uniref:Uncharacterized protein n=1 Tax=Streptomyces violarus TaxID=67380 RepID=A0A7W5EZ21_9ACTN|nr:hypothetical protein [Streptomyces violarus]
MLREFKAGGRPSGPEQCVPLADVLRAYTATAALRAPHRRVRYPPATRHTA